VGIITIFAKEFRNGSGEESEKIADLSSFKSARISARIAELHNEYRKTANNLGEFFKLTTAR
jgi:hypothetical protein